MDERNRFGSHTGRIAGALFLGLLLVTGTQAGDPNDLYEFNREGVFDGASRNDRGDCEKMLGGHSEVEQLVLPAYQKWRNGELTLEQAKVEGRKIVGQALAGKIASGRSAFPKIRDFNHRSIEHKALDIIQDAHGRHNDSHDNIRDDLRDMSDTSAKEIAERWTKEHEKAWSFELAQVFQLQLAAGETVKTNNSEKNAIEDRLRHVADESGGSSYVQKALNEYLEILGVGGAGEEGDGEAESEDGEEEGDETEPPPGTQPEIDPDMNEDAGEAVDIAEGFGDVEEGATDSEDEGDGEGGGADGDEGDYDSDGDAEDGEGGAGEGGEADALDSYEDVGTVDIGSWIIIQAGNTLGEIARHIHNLIEGENGEGISPGVWTIGTGIVDKLAEFNDIPNRDLIYTGATLWIPDTGCFQAERPPASCHRSENEEGTGAGEEETEDEGETGPPVDVNPHWPGVQYM